MGEWMANGVELGWLIESDQRKLTVYRAGQEPVALRNPATVTGEGPVAGFVLDLSGIWARAS